MNNYNILSSLSDDIFQIELTLKLNGVLNKVRHDMNLGLCLTFDYLVKTISI